jgi:hypothetical protein
VRKGFLHFSLFSRFVSRPPSLKEEPASIYVLITGVSMTKLVVAFVALFSAMMAVLLFMIIALSAALLIFSRGGEKREKKVRPLMEPEKTSV